MSAKGQGFVNQFNTALTANDATAGEQLGSVRVEQDSSKGEKWYMYVQASGGIIKGQAVIFTGAPYVVKADTTSAFRGRRPVAGVALGTLTTAYYGWIQIRGHNISILASPAICTSACTWTLYVSGGVFSIAKCVQRSGCTIPVPAGIFTYRGVAVGKSTSGFISAMYF